MIFWLGAVALAGIYFWSAGLFGAAWTSSRPEGYYNLQTAGFLEGHLYAAVEPHPGLLALADAYDPVANAPYRLHDMTYWHGKYYLYFGTAPILLVFLPWRLLTGSYLSEPAVVAWFVTLGACGAGWLLLEARRRFFPAVGAVVVASVVLAQALASPTLLLTQAPQFYQVPIACAYALLMIAFGTAGRVLSVTRRRRAGWLWLASLAFGCTLAARPNYILGMAALAVLAGWCAREETGLRKLRWLLPAFGPAVLIGTGLLLYNWARFGHATEFGMRYQLAGANFTRFTPLDLKYLAPHGASYLGEKILWQPYFPFVATGDPEAPFGILRYLPLTWLACFCVLAARRPLDRTAASTRLILAAIVGIVAVANVLVDSLFFFRPLDRYLSDFAPAFVLAGALGALELAAVVRRAKWPIVLAAGASLALTLGVFVYRLPPARYPRRLAATVDRLAAVFDRMRGVRFGGMSVEVELPANPRAGSAEPLLQSGHRDDRRDWFDLHYLPDGWGQVGFCHAGVPEVLGEPFRLPASRHLQLTFESNAFLPPPWHAFFDHWSGSEVAARRRLVRVQVAGKAVLQAAGECYPSRAGDVLVGRDGFETEGVRRSFSGRIVSVRRVAVEREPVPARERAVAAPLRLHVQLPLDGTSRYEPVVATGVPGKSDLLLVSFRPERKLQFALSSSGRGVVYGREMPYDPARVHELVVWLGAWAGGGGTSPADEAGRGGRLFVSFDGAVCLDAQRPFHPPGKMTGIGWNRVESEAAAEEFTGRILRVEEVPYEDLPAPAVDGRYGLIAWKGTFSRNAIGSVEPLVTTGVTGAGDILFIKYVDEHHVAFGLDHWGAGGPVGRPVEMDFTNPAVIEVDMGSLRAHPSPEQARRVRVRLNGSVALDIAASLYPSRPEQIAFGVNRLGGSSTGPRFTGRTLSLERPAESP